MPGDASAAVDSGSGPAPSSALTVPGGSQQRVRKEDVECDVEALVKAASFDTDHPLWREYPHFTKHSDADQLHRAILNKKAKDFAETLSRHGFRRFSEALMSSDKNTKISVYNALRYARNSFRQKEVQGTFNCAGALTVAVAGATTNAMTRANDQTSQANQATMKQAFEFSQRAINRFCESTDKNTQANQTNMKEVLSSLGKMTVENNKHQLALIELLSPSKSGGTETSGTVIPDQKKFASMVATEVVDGVVKVASAKKVRPVELFSSTQPGGTGLGFETAVAPAVPSDSPEAGTSNASITQARVNERRQLRYKTWRPEALNWQCP
mmetsp:Transcript_8044/g.18823  ORF Transcript_8044/g.18823 Transcript_8044/m.18823 type:complete len:326 (+) Transcript_8044:197-1174(+)